MKRCSAGATFVSVLLTVGVFASDTARGVTDAPPVSAEDRSSVPPGLARHLERLGRVRSGQGGAPGEAEAEAFRARAYPDSDIPLARLERARMAAAAARQRTPARSLRGQD